MNISRKSPILLEHAWRSMLVPSLYEKRLLLGSHITVNPLATKKVSKIYHVNFIVFFKHFFYSNANN